MKSHTEYEHTVHCAYRYSSSAVPPSVCLCQSPDGQWPIARAEFDGREKKEEMSESEGKIKQEKI